MELEEKSYKEIEILQAVITRQLEHALKVRGWLFLILSGLTIAYFTNKTEITWIWFLILSACLIIMFWVLEAIQHAILDFARTRMAIVESAVRGETTYDGPKICLSLAGAWKIQGVFLTTLKAMFSSLILIQVVMLIGVMTLLAFAKPDFPIEEVTMAKDSDMIDPCQEETVSGTD